MIKFNEAQAIRLHKKGNGNKITIYSKTKTILIKKFDTEVFNLNCHKGMQQIKGSNKQCNYRK